MFTLVIIVNYDNTFLKYPSKPECYKSPKKEQVFYTFKHLVINIKSYNADKI